MPGITFTKEDLSASNKLDAGWYKLNIIDIVEGPGGKDPSSTTWTCKFVVVDGPKEGTPITHWFSSKMQDRAAVFIRCFTKDPVPGKVYPIEETKGKQVLGYCTWDLANNRNTIMDFKQV